MMKERINLIGDFDQSKVSVQESGDWSNSRSAWYNITDTVKNGVGDKAPSVLEYVVKIEAEVCDLYDDDEDYLSYIKESFEDIVGAEFRCLGCFNREDGLEVRNDARRIRLTFANGSKMTVANSEWGSILFG